MKVNTKLGTVKDIALALTTTPVVVDKEVDVRSCVTIKAYALNAAPIYVGDRARQSFQIPAGGALSFENIKLNDLWVMAESGTAIAWAICGGVIE